MLTGLPAVALGIAVWRVLPDRPDTAAWLTQAERETLQQVLEKEDEPVDSANSSGGRSLLRAPFILLCVAYFCIITNTNTVVVWQPLIIRSVLGNGSSLLAVGVLSAIPSLVAMVLMPIWAASSDRRQERIIHCVIPVALAACGWVLFLVSSAPVLRLLGVAMSNVGSLTAVAILWTMPAAVLPAGARPLGIGVIATVGIAGALTCPSIVGVLTDLTGDFDAGIWYSAGVLLLAVVLILAIPRTLVTRPSPELQCSS